MAKLISLKINNCEECPFFNWNSELEEYQCKKLDKILFLSDYFLDNQSVVYKFCPFPEVKEIDTLSLELAKNNFIESLKSMNAKIDENFKKQIIDYCITNKLIPECDIKGNVVFKNVQSEHNP